MGDVERRERQEREKGGEEEDGDKGNREWLGGAPGWERGKVGEKVGMKKGRREGKSGEGGGGGGGGKGGRTEDKG